MGYIGADPALNESVTSAQIADDAITLAKMASGTDGAMLTYDADGNPVAITGTDGQVATSAGADAVSAFEAAGGITHASQWRVTTDFAAASDPTIITSNLEEVDTDGYGRLGSAMTEASGVFSFPSTGIWLIKAAGAWENDGESNYNNITIDTTVDDSTWIVASSAANFLNPSAGYGECWALAIFQFDVTDVSTHKVRFKTDCTDNATTCMGRSDMNETSFTFTKLGDT